MPVAMHRLFVWLSPHWKRRCTVKQRPKPTCKPRASMKPQLKLWFCLLIWNKIRLKPPWIVREQLLKM